MNIIIAGDGEVGFHLAKMLTNENHNITIVDPRDELLRKVENRTDLLTITGDSTSPTILQKAGIRNTDLLISVLHDESTNIITCILGKKLGAKRTIARIINPEYLADESREMFQNLGIDVLVCPERIASIEIVKLLKQPAATEFFEFSGGKLMLFLFKLDKNAPVVGKTLDQIAEENRNLDFRCIAIHRNSVTIIPRGKDKFEIGDMAYVISRPDGIDNLLRLGGKTKKEVHNVMIIGGGRIGVKTAKLLEKEVNLKLIDLDMERCHQLTEELRNTLIINGDARHFELLEEEGLCGMDAFLALTEDSGTNVFACLIARKYGVERTIALVENIDFIDISQRMGIDTIINKKLITASYIVRFTMGAEVLNTKCLIGVDAEVFEFVAKPGSRVTRKPIKDLSIPTGAIIGGIVRGKEGIIALGSTQIIENDKVVVFSLPEEINSLSRLFN
jgi:trk system potassium uptake protein